MLLDKDRRHGRFLLLGSASPKLVGLGAESLAGRIALVELGALTLADMARSLGVSEPTARRYLDALTDAVVVRQLQPWIANIGKRQVRSPKVYLRDTGTLHRLLGIPTSDELLAHPIVGAS